MAFSKIIFLVNVKRFFLGKWVLRIVVRYFIFLGIIVVKQNLNLLTLKADIQPKLSKTNLYLYSTNLYSKFDIAAWSEDSHKNCWRLACGDFQFCIIRTILPIFLIAIGHHTLLWPFNNICETTLIYYYQL